MGSISVGTPAADSLEQTPPSSCRQRLVLPTHPLHLRDTQPTECVLHRPAVSTAQEVLPVFMWEEMPLTTIFPPPHLR